MASEIVNLVTRKTAVHDSVIETLEEALKEARAGDITCIALAFVRPSGAINTSVSATDNVGALLGALALAQFRLCNEAH